MSNVLVNISKLFLILLNKKSKIAKHRCEQNTIKTHVWKTAMSVTKKNGKNTAVENAASTGEKRCKTDEKATGELQKEEEEY